VEDPSPAHLPEIINTCQLLPSAERLSIFSDFNAFKAHKHVTQTKSQIKVLNHQSTKHYAKYQELIMEGIVEKDTSNSYLTNASTTFAEQNMPYSAARI
jgi:hypothetical protein